MRGGERPGSGAPEWVDVQLQRAARTADGLQPDRLVPLRLPRGAMAGLVAGVLLLAAAWTAKPLESAQYAAAPGQPTAEDNQVRAMRELVQALPSTEARRRLEAALQTLESGNANADERRRALTQAQDAVDQIRMDAAASREGLQRLSQMLAGQKGLEEVAEALAKGDAKRAADLLAKVQAENQAAGTGNAPQPSEALGDKPLDQVVQALTDAMAEPQGGRPTSDALKMTVDRLNEIAKELSAAQYVNEAWKEVKGPQLQVTRGANNMTAGRFDQQQAAGAGNPSPSSGDQPMGGGTMFRSAAVAQGPGTEEQEGGTRMGEAVGSGQSDPLMGEAGQRLDAQLKQQALTGQEEQHPDQDQSWFYSESQKRSARSEWRQVEARARFSEAEAATAGGISIRHRQIVKDYFMNRPEAAK
jgi:exonuclease VII small subunit